LLIKDLQNETRQKSTKEGLGKFRMEALSGGICRRNLSGFGISDEHHSRITS
jgi:hypothetical protein